MTLNSEKGFHSHNDICFLKGIKANEQGAELPFKCCQSQVSLFRGNKKEKREPSEKMKDEEK